MYYELWWLLKRASDQKFGEHTEKHNDFKFHTVVFYQQIIGYYILRSFYSCIQYIHSLPAVCN